MRWREKRPEIAEMPIKPDAHWDKNRPKILSHHRKSSPLSEKVQFHLHEKRRFKDPFNGQMRFGGSADAQLFLNVGDVSFHSGRPFNLSRERSRPQLWSDNTRPPNSNNGRHYDQPGLRGSPRSPALPLRVHGTARSSSKDERRFDLASCNPKNEAPRDRSVVSG